MSDFEKEVLDLLEKSGHLDGSRQDVLRLQVTAEFERKKRNILIYNIIYHIVGLAFVVAGAGLIFGQPQAPSAEGLMVFITGFSLLIIIKLWYWIVHSRLVIVREIKQLELRLTQTQPPPAPPQAPPQE
jgi:hypothetical protein